MLCCSNGTDNGIGLRAGRGAAQSGHYFSGKRIFLRAETSSRKLTKYFFYFLLKEKTEFIPSSEMRDEAPEIRDFY